ncbi:MAG: efflux RND transporter periplasmic adaptor subunit [Anaerolineales bacterium]|nr:efflux RND transporter periplasmic adaptor subunit [Anaerolineales bacterium]
MKRTQTHILIVIIVTLLLGTTGCDTLLADKEDELQASGIVESIEVAVSSELGGQVVEVLAKKGETVQVGQVLISFEDKLLTAQQKQVEATLAQAQANYDLVATGPSKEQRQLSIAAAELELINSQHALDDLYENADLMAAQALHDIATADKTLDKAKKRVVSLNAAAKSVDVDAAWASVVLAREVLDDAREDFEPYEKKSTDNVSRALYLSKLTEVQKKYEATVTRFNNIVGTANQFELALAEAEVALIGAQLDKAQIQYKKMKDGPDPKALALAEANLSTAEANLAAAQADTSPEQLAAAQAQVDVAQTALGVVQAQMDKLIIVAPLDGVVLTRLVEPGEVVAPGATLLTIGPLEELIITVYIPEDQYGTINLGQTVLVSVDSFPGETFEATVIRIADQAEFTPRNVQTQEDRRTTVFAVELGIDNPDGKLKPGMPADVRFVE